jgi:hypothetical protein
MEFGTEQQWEFLCTFNHKVCTNLNTWSPRLLKLYLVMHHIFSVTTALFYFQTTMIVSLRATSESAKQWGNFTEVQRRYIWRVKSNIYDFQCDLNSGCIIRTRCLKSRCTKTVNHITVIIFTYVQFFTCNNWQHCGYTSSSFYQTCVLGMCTQSVSSDHSMHKMFTINCEFWEKILYSYNNH